MTPQNNPPSNVRTVSENTIMTIPTKDTLIELVAQYDALLNYSSNQEKYTDIAERLSKLAGKSPPWGWRYVQSVLSGSVQASRKFSDAVQTLAVTFDGVPVPFAKATPVTVYAESGTITEGAYVMSASKRCATPECTIVFVPNVPWREKCFVCNPPVKK